MEKNTQLPVEVAEEINLAAKNFAIGMWPDRENETHKRQRNYTEHIWKAAATAYASKLQEVEQENAELRRQNDKLKAMATGWRPLLEEVLKHDAAFGELSIEVIEKIKKFLYGE